MMMKKKILIILLCTILFVLIGASLYLKTLVNDVNSITVSNLNMANITDGINVISRQSLEVDAVSGATVSSKCIIKAIENALQSGSK